MSHYDIFRDKYDFSDSHKFVLKKFNFLGQVYKIEARKTAANKRTSKTRTHIIFWSEVEILK